MPGPSTGVPARRAAYRVRQFMAGLLACGRALTAEEWREVQAVLPERAWPLFSAMARNDQRHSLRVMRAVRSAGHAHASLLQAALLHDQAKSTARITLLHRTAGVLLRAFRPAVLDLWAQGAMPGRGHWRRPFWVSAHHAELGAAHVAAAGCDPLACLLVRHHQSHLPVPGLDAATGELLAVLQHADDHQ